MLMKKVIVIGCPGSGKSTFARGLKEATGLPLYHLDMMYWNSDRTTVERAEFISRLRSVLNEDEWIIDGNYASTLEMRLMECDTVFFLDHPTEVCLEGIEKRRGQPRSDMPWTETDTDEEFVSFVRKYNSESRPEVLSLLEKYSDKNAVIFHTRQEADAFLTDMKRELK